MAVRYIPVSLVVDDATFNDPKSSDANVIAAFNSVLKHLKLGYHVQSLEPAQFVVPKPKKKRHDHFALGKSPRALARAADRVKRMQKKTKTKKGTRR